jgi:hypothetical protein
LASGRLTISNITYNSALNNYLHTGVLLNGISASTAYGDDAQTDSNYPLECLTGSVGNVYYARTYNWNSTSVQATNKLVGVQFILPRNLPPADYLLFAVANEIASDPVTLALPFQLQIAASAPTNIILRWPAIPSNLALQTTISLNLPNWITVTNSPKLIGNTFVFTNHSSGTCAYFPLLIH